jgi:4-hydroxybenzoate polyprenyltransferase and related prenyltransferases
MNIDAWLSLLTGIFSYCAIAGANYIFNDIGDLEEDRNHPIKSQRPIASGQVGVWISSVFAISLLMTGFYAAYLVGIDFLLVLAAYLGLSIFYTVYLKHLVFVDVLVVAVCLVLRAVAGVVAIDVFLSPWLILTVLLTALMLAVAKRRSEFMRKDKPQDSRPVMKDYSIELLNRIFMSVSTLLVFSYSLYSFFGVDKLMMLTLPFAYYAVFRYWYLNERKNVGEEPHLILLDKPMIVNGLSWGCLSFIILYDIHSLFIGVVG